MWKSVLIFWARRRWGAVGPLRGSRCSVLRTRACGAALWAPRAGTRSEAAGFDSGLWIVDDFHIAAVGVPPNAGLIGSIFRYGLPRRLRYVA
jgi:hypothetical protein